MSNSIILMGLNQKKEGGKDAENEKRRNGARPRWSVTAHEPRDESPDGAKKVRRSVTEDRKKSEDARSEVQERTRLAEKKGEKKRCAC
jgi:hypothetical protein